MSLYKTQRCRHFDEAGSPIKPYCSQGNKCRFIHPGDRQWVKLKHRNGDIPSPENREAARSRGKNKIQLSPICPLQRRRSSPLVSQTDLFKRKQKDAREHDHRDRSVRNGDHMGDSDSRGHAREHDGPFELGCSLKRANDEGDSYPNQRPKLSERIWYGTVSGGGSNNACHPTQTDKTASQVCECDTKTTENVSDTFRRLAKLCCEIVQDTCFLDRGEDRLNAFTGLSSELSRAVPDAAMSVTPALAAVVTGHTRTRERLENGLEELETVWKTLFSILENDISRAVESRLEQAMILLDKERDNALRVIAGSQRFTASGLYDGTSGPRQWRDGWRETVTDRVATLSEQNAISVGSGPVINASSEETCPPHGGSTLSLVPTQEVNIGANLRIILEDMKMQMDRQTRAIELLAKENHQLKSATEGVSPQLVSPDSTSSSSRKPPTL